MSNFNWQYLYLDKARIIQEVEILIARSKQARQTILSMDINKPNELCNILADDTFEFNSFHSMAKLLQLVSPSPEIRILWESIDKILDESIINFNMDHEMFNKLCNIDSNKLSLPDKQFLDKVLDSFKKHKSSDLLKQINSLEDELIRLISSDLTNGDHTKILTQLTNLMKARRDYALDLGYGSHIETTGEILVDNLKQMLTSLVETSHDKASSEFAVMIKQMKEDNLDSETINNFMKKSASEHLLDITYGINTIFSVLGDLFKLKFELVSPDVSLAKWDPMVKEYAIYYNNQLYGYIYLDLFERQGKIPKALSIVLNEPSIYPSGTTTIKIPAVALIGSYNSSITYFDIIDIFRELAHPIHTILHRAPHEIILEPNMRTFMSHLFNHIAHDRDIIKKFYQTGWERISEIIELDRTYRLKLNCTYTLFDYFYHNTVDDQNIKSTNLVSKYNSILAYCFGKSIEYIKLSSNLPIKLIIELIYNGGLMYTEITNSIMSYNLYNTMKSAKRFDVFIDSVLRYSSKSLKPSIIDFIKSSAQLAQVPQNIRQETKMTNKSNKIKYISEEVSEVSDNTNYFTETEMDYGKKKSKEKTGNKITVKPNYIFNTKTNHHIPNSPYIRKS